MFPSYEDVMVGLSADITKLEQQRATLLQQIKRHTLIGVLVLLAVIIGALIIDVMIVIGIMALLIYVITVVVMYMKRYKVFRATFKEEVVLGIAKQLLLQCELPYATEQYRYECEYFPKHRVSDQLIKDSRLFNFGIDKIRGEDLFRGKLGLTEFKFSELTLIQTQTSTDSKGNTTRRDVTMFDGILFTADFNKSFSGVTILKSANIFNTGRLARLFKPVRRTLSLFSREKKRKINLENEDFNRTFHVETTDDITARYILTSSMMERLLKFKESHPDSIEISFVHSSMYVAITSGRNYFEPKLSDRITETQGLIVYEDLKFLFGMIEEFDLNTRIWSKA